MRSFSPPSRSLPRRSRATRARSVSLECLESRELLTGFNFADFSTTAGLNLLGSASTTVDNRLRLTPSVSSTGGAWYTAEKAVVAGNFETTFQFKLSTATGGSDGSDGFAFVIQNSSPTELRLGGGGLGYEGMPNSVAIEFDTWLNNGVGDPYNDPSQSHIGVHTNGTGPNGANEAFRVGSYYDTTTSGFILDNAQVHTARLSYTPGTLKVYLDNLTTPVLTVPVDLNTTLGLDHGRAWVGFTGAAGGSPLNQDLFNWSFSGDSNVVVANPASVIEGAAGTTSALQFTLDRLGSTVGTVAVNWTTANGTATAGTDYVAASGQVLFLDGESQKTVTVTVNGDATVEPNETLRLVLSTTSGVSVASGLGTILNDDAAVSVSDTTVTEGDGTIRPLGAYVSAGVGGMIAPYAMIVGGPDGNLYVSGKDSSTVYRFDAVSGNPLPAPGKTGAVFVSVGSGGLNLARDIGFGPDGALDVVSEGTSSVLRYDPVTGAFLGEVIASGSGGLAAPRGLTFRGGYAYVTSVGTETAAPGKDSVLRYDATTGAPAGLSGLPGDAGFIASGSGGLDNPSRIVFGPDGKAYVCSTATTISSPTANSVLRFDGATGAPAGVSSQTGDAVFVSPGSGGLDGPVAMVFRPDGYLYVSSWRNSEVLRYQAISGAFVDVVVPAGAGGLSNPIDLVFEPTGNLLVSSKANNQILRFGPGSQAAFAVSLSSASAAPVTVNYTTANGTALAGSDFVAASGSLTFAPGETTKTVLVPTVNDAVAEATETFTLNLSNATGGSITRGQGVATIYDDDSTKFYVVNDASSLDQTYNYGRTGSSFGNSALNNGNTAPRGAVSTAAGTTVWVVDANKHVYLYNPSGGLLGSWTAGSLSSHARVEGIATNGTDVWIVDAYQDKVYRYANAAGRLSGSQNATSSFYLSNSNANPKDIVTDGTSLWVVNDSTTDSVFKYTLSGSLLGSWTLAGAGTSPTGITLDPTNVGTLWVVDNGTDRVYQYDNAATLITGSQSPSTSFALAVGNTNPQGIADPPTATLRALRTVTAYHGTASPILGSSRSNGSPFSRSLSTVSIPGGPRSPILIPLTPTSDHDFTLPASAMIRVGTKRTKASTSTLMRIPQSRSVPLRHLAPRDQPGIFSSFS